MSDKQKAVHDAPAAGISTDDAGSGVVSAPDGKSVLVPAVDEEELAADLGTRGKRMISVKPPKGLGVGWFRTIVSNTYLLYMLWNRNPTIDEVAEATSVAPHLVKLAMESPEFIRAMLIRGVDFTGQSVLTIEQDMAIAIMATPNGKTFEQKLKVAGVAPSKWRAWLKQPRFREVWKAQTDNILHDHENDMMVALVGQALTGDTQAIKYAFEVSGRHNPAARDKVDAQYMLTAFIEILQEELRDNPQTLQKIASRMQLVAAGQSTVRTIEAATYGNSDDTSGIDQA